MAHILETSTLFNSDTRSSSSLSSLTPSNVDQIDAPPRSTEIAETGPREAQELRAQNSLLANVNVLSLAFKHLAPTISVVGNRGLKDLLSAALACRAFRGPALDHVWQSMHSLLPLLKLLPSFVEHNSVYYYYGDIRGNDEAASHFLEYSQRIRFMTIGPNDPVHTHLVSPMVITRLASQIGTSLLPCLKELKFESPTAGTYLIVPILLSTSITSICITSDTPNATRAGDFFQRLSPLLEPVALKGLSLAGDINFSSRFWNTFTFANRITSLKVDSSSLATGDDLQQLLSAATRLTSLRLSSPMHRPVELSSTTTISSALPLTWMEVEDPFHRYSRLTTFDLAFHLSGHFYPHGFQSRFPYLAWSTSITIGVHDVPTVVHADRRRGRDSQWPFLMLCSSLAELNRLRRLCIEDSHSSRPLLDTIPLFKGRHLESLSLHLISFSHTDGTKDSITEFILDHLYPPYQEGVDANGNSTLKSLALPYQCNATLRSLAYFSRRANGLEELKIGLDSSALPQKVLDAESSLPSPNFPTRNTLRHLSIRDTRDNPFGPREYEGIARYLLKLFPNVESVTLYHEAPGDLRRYEEWEVVESIRKTLKLLDVYRAGASA